MNYYERTEEQKKALAERTAKLWQDPEYRAKVMKKQKALGYRTYS